MGLRKGQSNRKLRGKDELESAVEHDENGEPKRVVNSRKIMIRGSEYEEEVKNYILKGLTYEDIIKKIKEKYGVELTIRQISYYKMRYVDAEDAFRFIGKEEMAEIKEKFKTMNIFKERLELARRQKERIEMDMKIERQMGKTINTLSKEIELYNSILTDIKKDMQELGVIEKSSEKIDISIDRNPFKIVEEILLRDDSEENSNS